MTSSPNDVPSDAVAGEFIAQRDGNLIICVQADDLICASDEFFAAADPRYVTFDGTTVRFTMDNGTWTYRVIARDEVSLRWFLRRIY